MQHLDEGMIHAWLDGQLPPDEAAAVEGHVAECRQCADAVAEARGLIAASSRILTALDSVPRDVAPKAIAASERALPEGVLSLRREAPPNVESIPAPVPVRAPIQRVRRRWFTAPTLAAAAAVVVAVGMFSLYQRDQAPTVVSAISARADRATDSALVAKPTVAAALAAPRALGGVAAANEAPPQAASEASARGARLESDRPVEAAKRAAFVDSAAAVDERRKVAEEKTLADASKPKELARLVPVAPRPDTSTVTVIRGTSVLSAQSAAPELAKASADRADSTAAGTIRGRVTDASNTGIAGAMVQVAGTNTVITTNAQGEYSLGGVRPGTQQLQVRRIGYQETKRDVSVVAGQTVSADVVVTAATLNLEQVVVTGTSATVARSRSATPSPTPAPASAPPPSAAVGQQAGPPSGAGCYDWTVTSTAPQPRTRFVHVPRRVAFDTTVATTSNDGAWYQARDLARTNALPNGLWRPTDSGIEAQWVIGVKASTVRLTGPAGAVMRGTIEEIDRAAGIGETGNVISVRRPCEG